MKKIIAFMMMMIGISSYAEMVFSETGILNMGERSVICNDNMPTIPLTYSDCWDNSASGGASISINGETVISETGEGIYNWSPQASGVYELQHKIGDDITDTIEFNVSMSYSVKFNANGGSGTMADQAFVYGIEQALSANAFTREGYTFAGWATSVDGTIAYTSGESISMTAPMTLYAVWFANTYAVSFSANGGEGTMPSQTFTHGVEQALSANAFTREGYTFAGWATRSDGAVAYTAGESISVTAPLTLYAVWEANTYAVSFNANGGEGLMPSQTFTHVVEQALSDNTFTREGYTFAGWATSADGAVAYVAGEIISVTAPMTLYAVWEQQTIDATGIYIVVDLSSGTSAASYPVTTLSDVPAGGWTDEYKTTKLVLRKITAGKMPRTDVNITLTKDYYVGVFEVTQRQWELVIGTNPSRFYGYTLPVEYVSYDDIRGTSNGSQWPASNAVDASNFIGKLRAKTGIDFDLPTAAQWENACRAGSSGDWGLLADGRKGTLDEMGWYDDNSGGKTHAVGTKTPNAWGLYDMHGNVREWCLDWYSDSGYSGTDPVGATTGSHRVSRGGCWNHYDYRCRSSYRGGDCPDGRISNIGLRVAAPAGIDIAQIYEVTFNANGGEGTMASQFYTYGVEQALSENTFTREGYTFAGWATSADGAVAYTAGESISVTAPLTLYAVWEANNTYAVSFSANGGEGTMPSQTFTHGVEQALSANAFTREGYTFAGWATSADGAVAYTAGQSISLTTSMTLYAVWEQQTIDATGTYIVVDLSGGTSATSYPVTTLSDVPAGGWTDEYKTTKLVLRKITAGIMPGRNITLTKDYYVGVFEVTQNQWELVMGDNPSNFDGDTLPVEKVSYDDIRGTSNGSQWPASNAVDTTSFMGKLRVKTGIDFDLPTAAQWEYACRAGSSGDWGLLANGSMGTLDAMGWYDDNSGGKTHAVGTKTPNTWGLYDMHGNVWEWCLDWYSSSGYSGTDPVGATTGNKRVLRGGSWINDRSSCGSSFRFYSSPVSRYYDSGLRVAAPAVTGIAQIYSVYFNANGGEGTMASQTFTHGVEQALSANAFTREGHTFVGWATSVDGTIAYTAGESISVTAPLALYAVWQQATYIVVDLSGGTGAANYPVTKCSGIPADGWTDKYKTTKLVLRKITAGKMPRTDVDITLTKDYYVGVFEVTQKQWELVMGSKPSNFDGDTLPVEKVSYEDIRGRNLGSQWPASNAVDSYSFMGKLRAKTGIDFDLPTEAQWEYACRAGSSGDWGLLADGTIDQMGWYDDNSSSKTHAVGVKTPNTWGLYDMHGNVWEWCLDWYGGVYSGTDPVGATSGDNRVLRGGCWNRHVSFCRSSSRYCNTPYSCNNTYGFRVAASAGIDIAQTYEVTFNANGGEGTMPSQTFMHGVEQALSANAFTREGYIFVGWSTSENGAVVYADKVSVKNLTAEVNGVVELYAVWEEVTVPNPVINPPNGSKFAGNSCIVTISCELDGAIIYYSPNGVTPRLTDAYRYKGPFVITNTSTIKTIAVFNGIKSDYVTAVITKDDITLPKAAGAEELVFTTGGDADWHPIVDASSPSGYSVESGEIGCMSTTWMKTTVSGEGIFSFKWKVDCEHDDSGSFSWDRATVYTNDIKVACIDGTSTEWEEVSIVFNDDGEHTIMWEFYKDDYDEEDADYLDAAWVTGVTWTPLTSIDPIPEISDASEIAKALDGSADSRLAENITSLAEYNLFREWATSLPNTTLDEVKASSTAWMSFALDQSKLIANEPVEGDVAIASLDAVDSNGSFEFTVNINQIDVGDGAVEENLKKLFKIEGATALGNDANFSSENVEIELAEPVNGDVKFKILPKDSPDSFFIRAKLLK